MSRDVPYKIDEICDVCGAEGAFDFMGDCICDLCIRADEALKELDEDLKSEVKVDDIRTSRPLRG